MSRTLHHLALKPASLGTSRSLAVIRYGAAGARPKAYLQASLHADEIPGQLVLHHLMRQLDAAADAIKGEIVIVPVANPIGQAQRVRGEMLGRFDMDGGTNFNRDFPDVTDAAAELLAGQQGGGQLGRDEAANLTAVRAALGRAIDAIMPRTETDHLRQHLLRLAHDADLALDLHCDEIALMHLYTTPDLWPTARDLAAELGAQAVMLARESGGNPFDEALTAPWWKLRARFSETPIPAAPCLAGTVELRGKADVDDRTAAADAAALYRTLQRLGAIAGLAGAPPDLANDAVPLEALDLLRTPVPGVIARQVAIGTRVAKDDVVCEIVNPITQERLSIRARCDGIVLSHVLLPFAAAGDIVAKVVGRTPLPDRKGRLLTDR